MFLPTRLNSVVIFSDANVLNLIGFEVYKAVTMNNTVFWDLSPCGLIISRRFGVTCRLHLQAKRNNAREEKC
jgi:hypothetical protein